MDESLPLSLVLFHCRFGDEGPSQPMAWPVLRDAPMRLPLLNLLVATQTDPLLPRPACAVVFMSNIEHRHPLWRMHALALIQAGPASLRMSLPRRPRLHTEPLAPQAQALCDVHWAENLFLRVWREHFAPAPGAPAKGGR